MNAPTSPLTIPPNARCVGCGYSLYQLEIERCPECGRQFDSRNSVSMGIRPKRPSWIAKRIMRPHSRMTFVLPWILTVMILIAPMVPAVAWLIIPLDCLTWIVLFAEHLPSMVLRRVLAKNGTVEANRIRSDNRLFVRMILGLSASLLLLFTPLLGFFVFFLFRSDLDSLAQRVPMTPVSYWDFCSARIGPFPPNAIDRTPHELAIGIMPSTSQPRWRPWASGIVFIFEDDPGYAYNNSFRWHLGGKWYLEYRPNLAAWYEHGVNH